LRAVFKEFGVPVSEQDPPNLADSSIATFLSVLLDALQAWNRDDVLDTIMSPFFPRVATSEQSHVGAFPLLTKLAAIVEGRDEWLARTSLLASQLDDEHDDAASHLRSRIPDTRGAIDALRHSLALLVDLARLLPRGGTRRQLAAAVQSILDACAVDYVADRVGDREFVESETRAIAGVRRLLHRMATGIEDTTVGAEIGAAEFIQELRRAFEDASYEAPPSARGVCVLDAEAARHRKFDYVFLAGMNEGTFPAPPPAGVIYTDRDIDDLISTGIQLERRSDHAQRELLYFHHILDMASQKLYVLWPTVTAEGKPHLASPLVEDLRLLTGCAVLRANASDQAFLPPPAEIACRRDLRNVARAGARSIERDFPEEFVRVETGAAIERRRYSDAPFDAYDGVLASKDLIAQIGAAYGPDHVFSVAQFERYAKCPFGFFAERILGITPVKSPAVEFDAMVRGKILHEVMQMFHQEFRGRAVHEIPEEDARCAMNRIIDEVFTRRSRHSVTAPRGVTELERARMKVVLERYLTFERENPSEWKPTHFEVAFGYTPSPSGDPLCRQDRFPLETESGAVLLAGQIDRIDMAGERARIIDYKSSLDVQKASSEIKKGVTLQLSLYAMAMERALMPGVECAEARFIQPGTPKKVEGMKKENGEWEKRAQTALSSVARCLSGIRSGHFPPTPFDDRCSLCTLHRACRYEGFRIERKSGP
jgi:ATP-dependent helicase/DNAse subunit B